jgi:hypothetical protein
MVKSVNHHIEDLPTVLEGRDTDAQSEGELIH